LNVARLNRRIASCKKICDKELPIDLFMRIHEHITQVDHDNPNLVQILVDLRSQYISRQMLDYKAIRRF
jgi:hypothetical protein